jgi:cytochrome c-type biogenesis protein CcmH
MVAFWILATLMTLLALAVVLVPLLRTQAPSGPSAREVALDVLRGQRSEIESDIAAGQLPADARAEAMEELVARAGEDLETGESDAPRADGRKPWIAAVTVGLAVPALAFGIYAAIGTPSASDPKTLVAQASASPDDKQIAGMVESLARKVRERPDDAKGWALLARSLAALGRFQESADAYEHLAKVQPNDPDVLADWADALGMAQGRTLLGRPRELAEQALKIDPAHQKALALVATAAMDAGDFAGALGYWQRVAATMPPGSPDAAQVEQIIAEVRGRAAAGGKAPLAAARPAAPPVAAAPARTPVAAAPARTPAPAPAATADPAAAKSVTGSVAVAAALKPQITGNETLFVFARSEGGPRVPLAVMRASAATLPVAFALDDSQSMAPGMNISSAQALRVEARLSRSGNATPQSGDLVGTSNVVTPGARGVQIVVDRVLP